MISENRTDSSNPFKNGGVVVPFFRPSIYYGKTTTNMVYNLPDGITVKVSGVPCWNIDGEAVIRGPFAIELDKALSKVAILIQQEIDGEGPNDD